MFFSPRSSFDLIPYRISLLTPARQIYLSKDYDCGHEKRFSPSFSRMGKKRERGRKKSLGLPSSPFMIGEKRSWEGTLRDGTTIKTFFPPFRIDCLVFLFCEKRYLESSRDRVVWRQKGERERHIRTYHFTYHSLRTYWHVKTSINFALYRVSFIYFFTSWLTHVPIYPLMALS